MKWRLVCGGVFIAILAYAQNTPREPAKAEPLVVQMRAVIQSSEGFVTHLKGNVEIKTAAMVLTADEASVHMDTGEIEAAGGVRVKLLNAAKLKTPGAPSTKN
jgi:lipopolysaccharide assembly outer membrane protein LptD (OstA)